MNRLRLCMSVLSCSFCAALLLIPLGCEIDGGDETVREVRINISGVYRNSSGIATSQSGTEKITSLNLSQSGDQLSGVDNLGARWTGTVNRVSGDEASVQLRGMTNNGVEVIITGTVKVTGTSGVLRGTWVEPDLRADVYATAEVAPIPTPTATPPPGATATTRPVATSTPGSGPTPAPTATIVFPPLPG